MHPGCGQVTESIRRRIAEPLESSRNTLTDPPAGIPCQLPELGSSVTTAREQLAKPDRAAQGQELVVGCGELAYLLWRGDRRDGVGQRQVRPWAGKP